MRKALLYSRSSRSAPAVVGHAPVVASSSTQAPGPAQRPPPRWRAWAGRYPGPLWAGLGALLALVAMLAVLGLRPGQRVITQDDLDAAVRH